VLEDELAVAIVPAGGERHALVVIGACGPHVAAKRASARQLFAVDVAAGVDAEDPVVPGILLRRRADRLPLRRLVGDAQAVGERGIRRVAHQPEAEDLRAPLARLGRRGGLRLVVDERLIDSLVAAEADELERPLPAAAARVLGRHEHVHVRVLAVADVVDEGDFPFEIVLVAAVAIEEHARFCLRLRLPSRRVDVWRENQQRPEDAEDETGEHRGRPSIGRKEGRSVSMRLPPHGGLEMKTPRPKLFLAIFVLALVPLFGPAATMQQAPKRPIDVSDVIAGEGIGSTVCSNDGQWFGYRSMPQEGDGDVVIRRVHGDAKEMRFPIGEQPQPGDGGAGGGGRGGPAAGGAPSVLAFSDDAKWVAFTTYPTHQAAQRLKRQRRPIQSSVTVVNLETGDKREYPKIRRFAFSGESSGWIALHRYGPDAPAGGGGGGAAPAGGGRGPAPAVSAGGTDPERPRGSDLLLRELATGGTTENVLNIGNVSEFSFRKDGRLLAL